MAYNTEDLFKKSKEIVSDKNIYFIEDIIALLGISKPTFYEHFSLDSNELNHIKEQLTKNKVSKKVELRKRLSQGDKAAEILALYKLIGTEEERKKLSSTYHDLTTKGNSLNKKPNYSNLSNEEILQLKSLHEKM